MFDLPIDVLTMAESIIRIKNSIEKNEYIHHVVVNAAKIVNAQKDSVLKESIVNCDMINADGQAVVWASRLLKKPLPERVAGIDLMEELVKLSAINNYRIFFLGAKEEVVKSVVRKYSTLYGVEIIAGYRNGFFDSKDQESVALQISQSQPHILFVAITSPKKEIFLNNYKHIIKVPFCMGVGGSFDVIAGVVKRAPIWMQKTGLEWLFRVIQEPGRMWKRYLFTNTIFLKMVLKEKLSLTLK